MGWEQGLGGDVLQVLLISILTGFALSHLGEIGERATRAIGLVTKAVFGMIRIIVRAAPIGAFGAMAFTVASLGVASLSNLAKLIGTFYLTSLIFVVVILGGMGSLAGAIIGGLILGVTENLWGGYMASGYVDAIGFGLVIAMLLVRPYGLFGKHAERA